MDYSFFDALIDAVFVVNGDKGIVYCNEAAAKLCDSSVRRLAKGKPIFETIEFSNTDLFIMPNGKLGEDMPVPYEEMHFKLKTGKAGKVQIAIQPFAEQTGDKRWVIMIRDVTLEEVLHAKYHKQLEEKEVYIHKLEDAQKQLEAYSKNLEQMVEERTQEVKSANLMLNAIMNSLGQGFLVFDKQGVCSRFYTKACEDILETIPANKKIWEILRIENKELATFQMWLEAIYAEKLPFEMLKELGPSKYPHSQDRHVNLDFFPIRNETGRTSNVVAVATDTTSEYLANKALEKEKKFAKMVIKLVTSRRQFEQFLASVPKSIVDLKKHVQLTNTTFDHNWAFRVLHTIEGEAGTYSISDIWSSSRAAQELLEPLRKGTGSPDAQFMSQFTKALFAIEESLSKFTADNSELFSVVGIGKSRSYELSPETLDHIISVISKKGGADLANFVADQVLRDPVESGLRHYDDVVQIVAEKTGKSVAKISFNCDSTRIYLDQYQDLFSSLIHAFRNAVDHGFEPPEEREMLGKPAQGKIHVQSEFVEKNGSNWLRLVIEDDGRGIDPARIREKLTSVVDAKVLTKMTDEEILQRVFDPGLSTKDEVGEFSGRGVGMNAILADAEKLGGTARVESQLGQGSKLIIEVPDLPRVVSLRISA